MHNLPYLSLPFAKMSQSFTNFSEGISLNGQAKEKKDDAPVVRKRLRSERMRDRSKVRFTRCVLRNG